LSDAGNAAKQAAIASVLARAANGWSALITLNEIPQRIIKTITPINVGRALAV
jgi:hypothetical protein